MAKNFFYLISSLPYLNFTDKPLLSWNSYQNECMSWLNKSDLSQISNSILEIENIAISDVWHPALLKWIIFENSIRTELIRFRTANLKIQPDSFIKSGFDYNPVVFNQVRECLKDNSPLTRELNLLKERWTFVSDLETGHYFDLQALISYSIKLQILERIQLFDNKKGLEVFDLIYKGTKNE